MNITVNGFSMAYDDSGQGSPLVLIHGYPLNRRMWQPQAAGLADSARVLTPDLRGHGDSQEVPGPYSMDLFAEDLNAFLDRLGIQEKIVLGGLSMGGYAAFAFYRKYNRRLSGLLLTATRAAADSEQARRGRDQASTAALENGIDPIVDSMAAKLLAPQTVDNRPNLVELAKSIMRQTPLQTLLADLAALRDRPDSTPTLAQIKLPTLILHGADDQIVPLSEAQEMHNQIAASRLVVIPEAGHLLNLEQPDLFNQAVAEFLVEIK